MVSLVCFLVLMDLLVCCIGEQQPGTVRSINSTPALLSPRVEALFVGPLRKRALQIWDSSYGTSV